MHNPDLNKWYWNPWNTQTCRFHLYFILIYTVENESFILLVKLNQTAHSECCTFSWYKSSRVCIQVTRNKSLINKHTTRNWLAVGTGRKRGSAAVRYLFLPKCSFSSPTPFLTQQPMFVELMDGNRKLYIKFSFKKRLPQPPLWRTLLFY